MSILTEQHAKELLTKVISFSKADEIECNLDGQLGGNIRYARNTVTTSAETSDIELTVQSAFGKRVGTATINEFDDASLKKVVQRSEELAKLSPENPEYLPVLGPQKYAKAVNYNQSTAAIKPEFRAEAANSSIGPSRKNELISSGFLNDGVSFSAIMNNKGLFAYNVNTNVDFSVTIKTEDGKGSGWVARDYTDVSKLDTGIVSKVAIDKAIESAKAKAMEPGKYTVILEPHASVQLLSILLGSMDQRRADEGRSFLSAKGKDSEGKNRLGEKMFDSRVNIFSDPNHPEVPAIPFAQNGYPIARVDWIKQGKVANMSNSRYWAEKTKKPYIPRSSDNQWIMEGGSESLEDMIKNTRRGILITRLWYIRQLDPQTLMYTGLTRDGTFYIENGKIKYPIKNLRFNESPIVMLNNIEAMGKPMRANGNLVPPLKIRDFTFTSTSDAV